MALEKIKELPKNIRFNQELIQEALKLGASKAKLILTQTITMANWVKLHCQYGCSSYGVCLTCPPYSPSVDEMNDILPEYEKALLINASPETNTAEIIIQLENYLKAKGFNKAFALGAQPCSLCEPCTFSTNCKHPDKARPTLQSCGIDVNETIHNNGWDDLGPQTPCTPTHAIGMVLLE